MTKRRRQLAQHEDHPRERLFRHGAQALSNAELVEVLLPIGCPGSTARDLARELLIEHGSLIGLSNLNRGFLRHRGIGKAKAATIIAAFEIARRVAREKMPRRNLMEQPGAVASYLSLRYGQSDQETMGALYLDVRNRLIGESVVFRGTMNRAVVEPRAIMKEALLYSASGFVLFHTHTSGDPSPSKEDLTFTRRMAEAGDLIGVKLLDHMILSSASRWVSLGRRGAW